MPEIISNDAFFGKISSVGRGEEAHHSELFPGIYPPDRDLHERALQGIPFETTGPFYAAARQALDNGARLKWFAVLPKAGEFGYTPKDLTALRLNLGVIAHFGFDVRTVYYSDHAERILSQCGESPVAQDFVDGLRRGEPRKSSWAIFRRGRLGRLTLDYLETMDYKDGRFLGHEQHTLPVNPDIAQWTYAWRETFEEFGEPVSPQSF